MKKHYIIILLLLVSLFLPKATNAEKTNIPGSTFPGTCAESMADVPQKDAYEDKSEAGGKSYAISPWYETAISTWRSANLTKITFAGKSKDIIGKDIYVKKAAATAWQKFGNDVANCPEVKNGLYSITIYDHFTCRVITPSALPKGSPPTLSKHALGVAMDINIPGNKYKTKTCQPEWCNYSPCFLKAAKDAGISWGGGPITPQLYPGVCDGHHFEWNGGTSNITEEALTFCKIDPKIAALYPASKTTMPTAPGAGTTTKTTTPATPPSEAAAAVPEIHVELPGYLDPLDTGWKSFNIKGGQTIASNWIVDYLVAIYSYGIVFGGIISTFVLMIGGLLYVLAGANPSGIQKAKTMITGALMGLVILMFTNIILNTINPNLTTLKPPMVEAIGEDSYLDGATPGDMEQGSFDMSGATPFVFPDGTEIPKGACLGQQSATVLTGNDARAAVVKFTLDTAASEIVSYNYGGPGSPCAKPPPVPVEEQYKYSCVEKDTAPKDPKALARWKNPDPNNVLITGQSFGGVLKCSHYMTAKFVQDKDKMVSPWELGYCTDCSGWTSKAYKCAAKTPILSGTGNQFGCTAESMSFMWPVPRSETIPGDIVGYANPYGKIKHVGHSMLCLDNGCHDVAHVHGPQAYKEEYIGKALTVTPSPYLDRLYQERLAGFQKTLGGLTWLSTCAECQDPKIIARVKANKASDKSVPILPQDALDDMAKKVWKGKPQGWKFEYRRVKAVEPGWEKGKTLPPCENVEKYSNCIAKPGNNCIK